MGEVGEAVEKDLFLRHERLVREKGLVVSVEPVNQLENGYKEKVDSGEMPLVTFTGYVLDVDGEVLEQVEAHDTFADAFAAAVVMAENF